MLRTLTSVRLTRWPFDVWGQQRLNEEGVTVDPQDRDIQQNFWVRHIGTSCIRLARVFRKFLLPPWIYEKDPSISVENKISVAKLKELCEHAAKEPGLTRDDRISLRTLEWFLAGEFRGGTGPNDLYRESDMPPK